MFDVLRCRCDISQHFRIGYDLSTYRSKKNARRLIKVQSKLSGDVKFILANSKYMYNDLYYTGVNVSKWLSQEKLNRIKRLRQQCQELNMAYSASNKGL